VSRLRSEGALRVRGVARQPCSQQNTAGVPRPCRRACHEHAKSVPRPSLAVDQSPWRASRRTRPANRRDEALPERLGDVSATLPAQRVRVSRPLLRQQACLSRHRSAGGVLVPGVTRQPYRQLSTQGVPGRSGQAFLASQCAGTRPTRRHRGATLAIRRVRRRFRTGSSGLVPPTGQHPEHTRRPWPSRSYRATADPGLCPLRQPGEHPAAPARISRDGQIAVAGDRSGGPRRHDPGGYRTFGLLCARAHAAAPYRRPRRPL